jgi:hypothetical protein
MRKIHAIALILGLSLTPNANGQEKPSPRRTHHIEPLPRDLEVQLALSSLPPHETPHVQPNQILLIRENASKGRRRRERERHPDQRDGELDADGRRTATGGK